ncbi:MAG TPA: hypothetical protein VH062_16895 [Polyangiaceae bacterium]|jgi:hypothetical protein|nr:hypothetical protein [Polyangiaceae bacterium]
MSRCTARRTRDVATARRSTVARLAVAWLALGSVAHAAGPLGPNGVDIRTSHYSVDLTQTPIQAGARVTGLAGAYVAIAEGIDGDIQTPVAPAVRTLYSVDHFEMEVGLGLTLPVAVTTTDFFNTGQRRTNLSDSDKKGFLFVTPAINLAWGNFGVGLTLELQNYSLLRSTASAASTATRRDEFDAQFLVGHLQLANRFFNGQLVLGGGLRVLELDVNNPQAPSGETNLFTTVGAGVEAGVLWAPSDAPFRLGAAFRSAVSTNPDPKSRVLPNNQGDRIIGDTSDPMNAFWLPDRIDQPWDLNLGMAVQVGPRPFNQVWQDPSDRLDVAQAAIARRRAERSYRRALLLNRLKKEGGLDEASEKAIDAELDVDEAMDELHLDRVARELRQRMKFSYAGLPRPYALLALSVVLTGSLSDAVGIESFLQRVVARSGEKLVYSPRLGLETELVPGWLKLRAGTYGEPTRFTSSSARLHGTLGFDAKVFPWSAFGLFEEDTQWRITTSLDAAARYLGWGVGVGVWH